MQYMSEIYFFFLFILIILRAFYSTRSCLFRPLMHLSTHLFPSQTAYKYSSLLPQVYLLVHLSKEKDGNGNEVIRVCLVQIPLVNTKWYAVVSIHSITIASVVPCTSVCPCLPSVTTFTACRQQRFLESLNSRR